MADQDFDLFGLPVDPASGQPGRPRKLATTEDRNKIKLLMAQGWTVDRMAPVVRMSGPTFRRNFFHEIKERDAMRDRLYARRMELLMSLGEAGNVAALKELGKMLETSDRLYAEAELVLAQRDHRDSRPDDEPARGKKDQAKAAARHAELDPTWGNDLSFTGGKRSH